MKIKFEMYNDLEENPQLIYDKILDVLKEEDYQVIEKTAQSIIFNKFVLKFTSRMAERKIDEGVFDFIYTNGLCQLRLTYYMRYDMELYFAIATTIVGLLLEPYCFIFVGLIALVLIDKFFSQKSLGRDMLDMALGKFKSNFD